VFGGVSPWLSDISHASRAESGGSRAESGGGTSAIASGNSRNMVCCQLQLRFFPTMRTAVEFYETMMKRAGCFL
jgi:hypothetical protein